MIFIYVSTICCTIFCVAKCRHEELTIIKFDYTDTTPPKTILSRESRLFEVDCVPSAILHFGSQEKQPNYLKEDILEKVSSPKASLMQALSDRYVAISKQSSNSNAQLKNSNRLYRLYLYRGIKKSGVTPSREDENQPSSSSTSRTSNALNFNASKASGASGDSKMPKWLKPFAK